eukprot:scaffold1340_cov122-Cylindrotheca_fusiformis.AAC.5
MPTFVKTTNSSSNCTAPYGLCFYSEERLFFNQKDENPIRHPILSLQFDYGVNFIHTTSYRKTSSAEKRQNKTALTMTEEKQLYVTDPEKWVNALVTNNDFVGIVIFRGSWCKYDKHYLQRLGKFSKNSYKSIQLKLIAWTSEGAEGAKKADEEWELTSKYGFDEVIGDDTNALAKYLVDDFILEKLVTMKPEEANVASQITPGTYPNGLVQPGMVWYAHNGSLVLQWESEAKAPGFGGPNRPHPKEIWEQVQKRKHALDKGDAIMPVHGRELRQCTTDLEVCCVIS